LTNHRSVRLFDEFGYETLTLSAVGEHSLWSTITISR